MTGSRQTRGSTKRSVAALVEVPPETAESSIEDTPPRRPPSRESPAERRRSIHKKAVKLRGAWRADYILFLWTLPLIALFVPVLRGAAKSGFSALRTDVPDWYVQMGGIMVASLYGFKSVVSLVDAGLRKRQQNSSKG